MSDFNRGIIEEFRANGGVVGGNFEGMNLLLVHTIGAKTGLERINPVAQISDGDRYVIIASKGGAPTNPDWYYNLKVNPEATIEVGTQVFPALAAITEEPERSELFEKMASHYPGFEDYKEKTKRVIPVVTLTRQ